MILGLFCPNEACLEKHSKKFQSTLEAITSGQCIAETTKFQSLQFTFVHHPDLFFSINDCLYIDDQKETVVFIDGNIYNINTLKVEYNIPSSTSNAQLISILYLQYGLDFLNKLNGAFSIGIFDFKRNNHYLIKDQLGIVPLSIAKFKDSSFFCSDTQGMTRALFADEKIAHDYIISRFYDYDENYSFTPNENVQKILPGHYTTLNDGNTSFTKYWFPESIQENASITSKDAVARLNELVKDSIEIRSDEKYTAGAHISGGLDSSYIATLAREPFKNQNEFYAFTWSPFDNINTSSLHFDERVYIRKQCETAQLKLIYTDICEDDYHAFVNEWRCSSEHIFENQVLENAKKNGVNLIFSGWGGDEFIGVRDEGLYYETATKLGFKQFLKLCRNRTLRSKIMVFVNNVLFPKRRKPYRKFKMHPEVYKYLKKGVDSNKTSNSDKSVYATKKGHQISLLNYHHLAQRCEDWYINGQRKGVEYRYPLLDIRIAEYCLSLKVDLFVGEEHDRPLIRNLTKGALIEEIRLLMKQSDPVAMYNALQIQKLAIKKYRAQIDEFRKNQYLSFFDFDMLESDIQEKISEDGNLPKRITYTLFYLKSTHEYTRNFHQGIDRFN
jgi:asparagine synthase (glutamine-hydrolysing)